MRQLPAPAVEQLLSAEPGAAIVGACPVGDALTGSALMAATSDGKLHCLWPSGARTSDMVRVPDCEILGNPRYVLCGLTRCVLLVVIARVTDSVAAMQEEGARSVGGDAASAEVERMYGALLQGPRALRPPEGMGLPLRTPQGTRALSEAIHGLLEGHVEYIHHAHHHLLPVLCSPALAPGWLSTP